MLKLLLLGYFFLGLIYMFLRPYSFLCAKYFIMNMTLSIVSLFRNSEQIIISLNTPMTCKIPWLVTLPSPLQSSWPRGLFSPDTRHTEIAGKSRMRCRGTRSWYRPPTSLHPLRWGSIAALLLFYSYTDRKKALEYRQTSRNTLHYKLTPWNTSGLYRHVSIRVLRDGSTLRLPVLAHVGEGASPEGRAPELPETSKPLLAPGLVHVIRADAGVNQLLRLLLNPCRLGDKIAKSNWSISTLRTSQVTSHFIHLWFATMTMIIMMVETISIVSIILVLFWAIGHHITLKWHRDVNLERPLISIFQEGDKFKILKFIEYDCQFNALRIHRLLLFVFRR